MIVPGPTELIFIFLSLISLILPLAIAVWLIISVQAIKQSLKVIEQNTEKLTSRDQDV